MCASISVSRARPRKFSFAAEANQTSDVEILHVPDRFIAISPTGTTTTMAELAKTVARQLPSFKLGQKQVFLSVSPVTAPPSPPPFLPLSPI